MADSAGQDRRDLSVSVIVPTYNRRERLGRLLAALERHHRAGASFEVFLTVDGSEDGTQAMLASLRTAYPLRVIVQPRSGPSAARNAAIAAATGDVLLFLDDDVVPQDGVFERHLAVHRGDPLAAVIGKIAAPPGLALPVWLEWEAAMGERLYSEMLAGRQATGWRQFFTANASVRREHVLAVGGFDTTFTRTEDMELAHRLADRGVRFYFVPEAIVHHEPDRTLAGWLHMAFESGRHRVFLERQVGAAGTTTIQLDWQQRHPLNRTLARWCVGHAGRKRLAVAALRYAIASARLGSRRSRLLLCSALYNLGYWDGVAVATGLGTKIWRQLVEPRATTS